MDFSFTASSDGEDLIEGEDNMKKAQIIDDWCHQYLHPPYDDVPKCLATSTVLLLLLGLLVCWSAVCCCSVKIKDAKIAKIRIFLFFLFFSSLVDEKSRRIQEWKVRDPRECFNGFLKNKPLTVVYVGCMYYEV
jgi:hypothetical protein